MMNIYLIGAILVGVFIVIPGIVASFLRNVEAGTIRIVSWLHGGSVIYRGPGKSKEIPLLTTGTTSTTPASRARSRCVCWRARSCPSVTATR